MAEQSGKLLLADKRLAELEANMDTKRKTESYEEMLKQLKSALKEEIAALKPKVRETHSTCYVCSSFLNSPSAMKYSCLLYKHQ